MNFLHNSKGERDDAREMLSFAKFCEHCLKKVMIVKSLTE